MKKADPFYTHGPWLILRRQALIRDHYLCQKCLRRVDMGLQLRPRAATMVHHIVPRSLRPDLELNLDNLESLCDACHNEEHPERGFKRERKEALSDRRCVTVANDRSLDKNT
ncbi:MAG: HNH endonuclease [Deltaproteobacteria bacterium]|nr:HNH endonuclease [Deltaproteobacteria bacterium]